MHRKHCIVQLVLYACTVINFDKDVLKFCLLTNSHTFELYEYFLHLFTIYTLFYRYRYKGYALDFIMIFKSFLRILKEFKKILNLRFSTLVKVLLGFGTR